MESSLINDRQAIFGRFEMVGKPAHDLHAHEFITMVFTVAKAQGGYARYFRAWRGWLPGVGVTAVATLVPPLLAPRYAGRIAPGIGLFLTIHPSTH